MQNILQGMYIFDYIKSEFTPALMPIIIRIPPASLFSVEKLRVFSIDISNNLMTRPITKENMLIFEQSIRNDNETYQRFSANIPKYT